MHIMQTNIRSKAAVWLVVMLCIGFLAEYFTYTIGLSPVDQPNSKVFPFLPGIFLFALSHGFRESSLPNTGLIAFLIATFNACFYMAVVYLMYRWTRPSRHKTNSMNKDIP